jgi:hypothetical protein
MQQLVAALGLQLAAQQQQQGKQQQQQPGSGDLQRNLSAGSRADLASPDAIAQQAADQRGQPPVNPGQPVLFDWSTGAGQKVNAVVKEVLRLLGVEAKAVAAQQLLDMCEELVAAHPEELLVVVVRRCQQLLGVEGVEGVVPALNKVSRKGWGWGKGVAWGQRLVLLQETEVQEGPRCLTCWVQSMKPSPSYLTTLPHYPTFLPSIRLYNLS